MDNGAKITQESKKFVIDVIRAYRNLGEGAHIKIRVGNSRNIKVDGGTRILYVTTLGREEAEQIKIMYDNERNFEPDIEMYNNMSEQMRFQRVYEQYVDDFDPDLKEQENQANKSEKEDFKERLKYNIEERRNDPRKEERKNRTKRNLRNIPKTMKRGGKFIAANGINMATKRRILAFIGVAFLTYSVGRSAYDMGKANEYIENSKYTSVEEAIDGEQEELKEMFEKQLQEELDKDVKVVAEPNYDYDDLINTPNVAVQNNYGFNYKIPNEMKKILKDIPRDGNGYISDRIRLCDLLNTRKKIEKYFEENKFSIEKNKGLGIEESKIVQSKASEQEVR